MTGILRPAATTVVLFTALLGLAAPAALTGLAGAAFPDQAGGSLVSRDGAVIGSSLIGQAFAEPRYFQPRPSAAGDGYDASAGAASQQGPTSAKLVEAVRERVAAAGAQPVPADAVTASGSGLDPHVSPENAARQVARVAAARNLPEARVQALLQEHVEGREFGLLGERRVNVLRLNLALDALR
ncbi:potassium-transporting ATPase subunit C [Pseudoroseomonas deserti]|uniref:Potassium-transporting ATPase KdpC subunit n=1 Tax=Teichococcus deserti TaxID=1817963 RepID=A0A1V2GVP1_9PROT|nr:potassium-transporting ATPase subunit KdpC [Pseudoroseomonas deserti]ONG46384.1 potassium-transporting ATPase subunit C [Pseudoroseomonas deserti]